MLTQLDFADQVVLVTGASSGIGAAVARGFAGLGARTILHYNHNAEGARATLQRIQADGGKAATVTADLTDPTATADLVGSVVEGYGRVDVLVNNAGDLVRRAPLEELTDEDYRRIVDVNVTSMFAACRAVLPQMRKRGGGAIVNMSSIAARTGGAGGSVVYAAAKGAVSTFTRGLAREVAADNIRVNAVAPGVITTPFHDRHTTDHQMTALLRSIPMGRAGLPEEIAGAVLFLASPVLSGYVTGQVIEINGGQLTP